jgi:tetratricopeptide (TPR) repeat protein
MSDPEAIEPSGSASSRNACPAEPRRMPAWSRRVRLIALAGLILAVSLPARAQSPTDYYITRSDKAAGNLLQQVEKYHLAPGIQNARANKYQYAHGELGFILRYFPNHPQALMLMAEVCVKWKHPAQCNADAYFQKALEINPQAADTYTIQGIHLQNTGRIDQAIDSYKMALERNPSSMNAHYNLGLAYANKKNFEEANKHAQEAYALGMTLPGLRNMLTKAGAWRPLPAQSAAPPAAGAAPSEAPAEGGSAAK